jgi:hypothetical protein
MPEELLIARLADETSPFLLGTPALAKMRCPHLLVADLEPSRSASVLPARALVDHLPARICCVDAELLSAIWSFTVGAGTPKRVGLQLSFGT